MKFTATLAADLALLTAALYDPAADPITDVADTVLGLVAAARLAVRSLVGLTITFARHSGGAPDQVLLRFTLLDDHVDPRDIETSLRLPGPTDGAGSDRPTIEAVLYAATPGAFVDLAADLSFLTGREFDAADIDQHRGLAGEGDISGVLQAETAIHEAVGVLIARGRTREQAYAELDTLAVAAHTHRGAEALRILAALPRDGLKLSPFAAPGNDLM